VRCKVLLKYADNDLDVPGLEQYFGLTRYVVGTDVVDTVVILLRDSNLVVQYILEAKCHHLYISSIKERNWLGVMPNFGKYRDVDLSLWVKEEPYF
jgi:hypothetical protein